MFSKNNKVETTRKSDYNSVNIIGDGSEIKGDIYSESSFRIDGVVIGNIDIKGKLLVSPMGKIEGEIACVDAEICGQVYGNIYSKGTVSVKTTASIKGDINYEHIEIEQGANLDCRLQQATPNVVEKKESKEPKEPKNPIEKVV